MDEKFNELIARLQEIGYDPDNEDLMDLDMYEGYGFVHFYGPDRVNVVLKFKDFELDLQGQGHMLKFFKTFTISAPSQAVINGADREFQVELELISLPNQFFEVMTRAIEIMSKVEVK